MVPVVLERGTKEQGVGAAGVSGPDHDSTISPTSLCGPKISLGPKIFLGPDNDCLGLNSNRSLCSPRQNFVVLGLDNDQIRKLAYGPRTR